MRECAAIRNGIVISPLILAAIALILGDLWEQRGDTAPTALTAKIPFSSRSILDALRAGPGL